MPNHKSLTYLGILSILALVPWYCSGELVMTVSPYPARVYSRAPPGVDVVTVIASDNQTGRVTTLSLEQSASARLFRIDSKGVIRTARNINYVSGTEFSFAVYAYQKDTLCDETSPCLDGTTDYRQVKIIVSNRNYYPPTFARPSYSFPVYRYGTSDVIGNVTATDNDVDLYNRHFTIYAPPRQEALKYVSVDESGRLTLVKPVSESTAMLDVRVLAVDSGSPQLTGTTTVTVDFLKVKQPDKFCFSSRATSIRLCWKNPMPGQEFRGYNVTVSGAVSRKEFQPAVSGHQEACYTLHETVRGEQYMFKVMVDSDHFWYGGKDLELVFNHSGIEFLPDPHQYVALNSTEIPTTPGGQHAGHHKHCIEENFSACSYLYPCSDSGRCVPKPGGSHQEYSCACDEGWQGDKCQERNLCHGSTHSCHFGRCQFQGHNKYKCLCMQGYVGPSCDKRNPCLQTPCANQGQCQADADGSFTCSCSPGFAGRTCEVLDPCTLNPCVANQGKCERLTDTQHKCVCFHGYYGDSCEMENQCILKSRPCFRGGTCHNTSQSFYCECPPGTSGDLCQDYDPCFMSPCQNEGRCSKVTPTRYQCECPLGFYGSECQYLDRNNCQGIDCHNGSCYRGLDSRPRCVCWDGYQGEFCEHYDVCLLTVPVCNARSNCISFPMTLSATDDQDERFPRGDPRIKDGYRCECKAPWHGENCQLYNTCFTAPANTCKNGGQCVPIPTENSPYKCECAPGFYGPDCSQGDPCSIAPCQHGGSCSVSTEAGTFRCTCAEGYLGSKCQFETKSCSPDMNPCHNGARCVMVDLNPNIPVQFRFLEAKCICPEEFTGRHCHLKRPCHPSPCVHGECVETIDVEALNDTHAWHNTSTAFACGCRHGYTGALCEVPIDQCMGLTCFNGGRCYEGQCVCTGGFTGVQCGTQIVECTEFDPSLNQSCQCVNGILDCSSQIDCEDQEEVKLTTLNGSVYCAKFPPVTIRKDMIFRCCHREVCQIYNPDCETRSHCSETGVKDPSCYYFATACQDGSSKPCVAFSHLDIPCADLTTPGDNGWLQCAQGKLNDLSSADPLDLDVAKVALYGKIVEDLREAALVNKTIAQLAMDSISKLASVNISVSQQVETQNRTNMRLRSFIDDFCASVYLGPSGSRHIQSEVFTVRAESFSATGQEVDFEVDTIGGSQVPMSINVPKDVLDELNVNRIHFVAYQHSQLFINPSEPVDPEIVMKQAVISATVTNHSLSNLTSPVIIVVPKIEKGKNHTCVFWDDEESQWSTEGVTTFQDKESGQVTCKSIHLTSFAVLLSPTPEAVHSDEGLTYITYVGCAISMACLVITLVTYGLFKCLHGEKSGKILLHLCTALLLLNAIFLAGTVDVSDFDQVTCTIIALLLHYLVLASLTWMLVEAIEMYQAIVTVFAKYERFYLLKRCIIAWGVPALIVAITAAVDISMYGSKAISGDGEVIRICFLSGGSEVAYYVSLLTPACIIIIINTVVFIMVARVILKPRFQGVVDIIFKDVKKPKIICQQLANGSSSVTPAQVRGALTVMFLLGITWVFGPLAIGKATVVFSYLFCICNSLQGCLIFVFRCLFNPEARLAWTQLIKTGTLKRRRGPIKSGYTDSSSSKAGHDTTATNRRLSNSTSTHLSISQQVSGSTAVKPPLGKATGSHLHPHQLHNTNGWHPSLNGWRRDNGHITNNPLHTGFESIQPSDPERGSNSSLVESLSAKKDIVQPDYEDNFQDELTHL